MYASLYGTVTAIGENATVVECGGVGYLAQCPIRTLSALTVGQTTRLFTHLSVREDALTLFGFATSAERDFFIRITSVSGVGPKIGLSLLSTFTPGEIANAISANQPNTLARASGVGKKLAEKIIVEFKDKLGSLPIASHEALSGMVVASSTTTEVASALVNLGYAPKAAEMAADAAYKAAPEAAFDVLFKQALSRVVAA